MSALIPDPVKLALTIALQDLTSATPAGKVRTWYVRFANVGADAAYGDLVITNGTIVINRVKNYPVPYQQAGSAPDMEEKLMLPAGWKIQAKASATGFVEASAFCVEADTADFT